MRRTSNYLFFGLLTIILSGSCGSSKEISSNDMTLRYGDCNIAYTGFDKNLRKERKELELEHFFGFTSDKLKPVFKERDFIECKASLTKLDKDIYLRMNLEIAAPNASSSYGQIPKGNIMVITMINGDKIYSYSAATSKGKYDKVSKKTVFDAIYLIEKEKELRAQEIDRVGIMWTTGYEEYPIYEVDFLRRQFKCLGN